MQNIKNIFGYHLPLSIFKRFYEIIFLIVVSLHDLWLPVCHTHANIQPQHLD